MPCFYFLSILMLLLFMFIKLQLLIWNQQNNSVQREQQFVTDNTEHTVNGE